jgi:hypothetical protein
LPADPVPCLPAEGCIPSAIVQQRLYFAHVYTDDPIFGVVGVRRALAALRCWRGVTAGTGLIMAIPEKRSLGTWTLWLGILLLAGLGLAIVPKGKLLRAMVSVRHALSGLMEFGDYRALTGLLEHIRCVNCAPRSVMHGLYHPHGPEGASRFGPNGIVKPTAFMTLQLQRWLDTLQATAGTPVLAALDKAHLPTRQRPVYTASADAATDSRVPGLGGYCHGLYWYVPIHMAWLDWLHITVLELLATGINAIVFANYLGGSEDDHEAVLQSDALATPYALARQSERAEMLQLVHHLLLADPDFQALAQVAKIAHLSGDCNPFSDAVSRGEWDRFYALCRAVGVVPRQLAVPQRAHELVQKALLLAQVRGKPIRRVEFKRARPQVPAALRLDLEPQPRGVALRMRGHGDPPDGGWEQRWLERLHPATLPQRDMPPRPELEPTEAPLAEFMQRLHGGPSEVATATVQLTTTQAAGITIPAVIRSSVTSAPAPPTALRLAAAAHAAKRAKDLADSPFGSALMRGRIEGLIKLLQHAEDLADYGGAHGTRKKEELAWKHWESFAEAFGFDPLLTAAQVRDHPEHVATLMATYMLHVYPKMKGKAGRLWAKPRSVFSYVLSLIRIFRKWKVILPPAKVVKDELNGLLRGFVVVYGKEALQPSRREPLKFPMLCALCNMPDGATLRRGFRWDSQKAECKAFGRMLAVGWHTGHRLAEFVEHPSGEVMYLTRADVTWMIGGVAVSDPTPAQLASLRPGDSVLIAPPRSKTDQFGEIHSPFPSCVLFDPSRPGNAGARLRDLELERPCRGAERATTPLFCDDFGRPFTHSRMDELLYAALLHLYGAGVANSHSWHSLRSGLACALKEAGCPPDEIQLICRWLNPESLRAYARLGTSKFISWVDAAEKVTVDSLQTSNAPKFDLCEGFSALHLEFGHTLSARAQQVLDQADQQEIEEGTHAVELPVEVPPDLSPLTAANCVGRRVMVLRSAWPRYSCEEFHGNGWAATVVAFSRRLQAATVTFLHATTSRGIPYEDANLSLHVLIPI